MAELDQKEIKSGVLTVLKMATSGWGNLARLCVILTLGASLASRGWLVYTGKVSSFIPSNLTSPSETKKGTINPRAFDEAAKYITARLDADLVIFGTAKMGYRSTYTVEKAYTRDGDSIPILEGYTGDFFEVGHPDQHELLSAIGAGDIPCGKVRQAKEDPKNLVHAYMQSAKIKVRCGVSIPPEPNAFDGGILVGWKDENAISNRADNDIAAVLLVAASMATLRH